MHEIGQVLLTLLQDPAISLVVTVILWIASRREPTSEKDGRIRATKKVQYIDRLHFIHITRSVAV
jgi:hypothetical protein